MHFAMICGRMDLKEAVLCACLLGLAFGKEGRPIKNNVVVTQCQYKGTDYNVGDSYIENCETCTCVNDGTFTCVNLCCERDGIYYEAGASFQDGPCCDCECVEGLLEVLCKCMSCTLPTCPDSAVPEGECCPSCP